uniref:Uncharacterized protein n=1 Tax=Piliocolobus tephrosceles TaxID=591936 RepID=A0A8C9J1V8_9PRIM
MLSYMGSNSKQVLICFGYSINSVCLLKEQNTVVVPLLFWGAFFFSEILNLKKLRTLFWLYFGILIHKIYFVYKNFCKTGYNSV